LRAFSLLSQKPLAAVSDSISASRLVTLGTSKKPPQVRELAGGGVELSFDGFEHREER
jgi:hypothetical protein